MAALDFHQAQHGLDGGVVQPDGAAIRCNAPLGVQRGKDVEGFDVLWPDVDDGVVFDVVFRLEPVFGGLGGIETRRLFVQRGSRRFQFPRREPTVSAAYLPRMAVLARG